MALSAATVWECRASGASDTNGGGFVAGSGGTDRSQQNAAQVAVGGGTVTSSITGTVVTFTGSTYTVLTGDVGNTVQFISGTNVTAGFYQIVSVSAGVNGTWTLDRAPITSGTTTNAVANMGGALATLGVLATAMVVSNKAYCTGAFTTTSTNTFPQSVTPSATAPPTRLIGYGSTRGDSGHATLTLSTNASLTGINATGNGFWVEQIDVNASSLAGSTGINLQADSYVARCKVMNTQNQGISVTSIAWIEECEVTGAAGNFAINMTSGACVRCYVHDNTCAVALGASNSSTVAWNLVVNNTGASTVGIRVQNNVTIDHNTIHNNGSHGIAQNSALQIGNVWRNNLITANGGFGILGSNGTALPAAPSYDGNAFWNNTSGARGLMDSTAGIYGVAPYTNVHDVTLSGNPYVGPTTGSTANFGLNNTAGAGAACRAAATPSAWAGNTGTGAFPDMGAVQHQDTGGSKTPYIIAAI